MLQTYYTLIMNESYMIAFCWMKDNIFLSSYKNITEKNKYLSCLETIQNLQTSKNTH